MKKVIFIASVLLFMSNIQFAQSWQPIEEGQNLEISGLTVSFIKSYIKEVKGQDAYQVTATIANNGNEIIHLFPQAIYDYVESPQYAWAHFRFTNATGKGLSSREGYIYPDPIHMMFPYKCNPDQKKPTYDSRIIGIGMSTGQSKTNEWRVRVNHGEKLEVQVFIKTN